ncbi:hypothetical protein F5Y19DRAFT_492340 [Xylariaceae sp. FL1651]|nr:hypothetical protein F5Y19DRAFT_492340 [Xylariaceae sp. FL1651]
MADLQKPAPAKRALPFKRTVRPKPPSDASPADEDGLALFSQSKNFFPTVVEDQQRRAREKAAKAEQERKEKFAREQEEKQKELEAQLRREKKRRDAQEEREAAKKRHRRPLSDEEKDDDDDDDDDDDVFTNRPRKSRKPSSPYSPVSKRDVSAPSSSRGPESTRVTRASQKGEASVVLLDSSDDEDPTKRTWKVSATRSGLLLGGKKPETTYTDPDEDEATGSDGSESELEIWQDKKENKEGGEDEEDPSEFYIRAAMERMQKAKEARLARESSSAAGGEGHKTKPSSANDVYDDDERGAPVSVMIAAPGLPEAKVLCCTVRTAQALQIAFDTFKERQKTQTGYPHQMLSELVFTWRGDRVYHTTKLETLGIRPRGRDGRLHDHVHSGREAPEGYVGRDKVYFEAWTPEDYDENQRRRERERKRRELGEWWDEDDENDDGDGGANGGRGGGSAARAATAEAETSQGDDRVKVIFKARDMPPRNVTLRKHSTVAQMIKAFRKLAGLGEDKHIEIRWDGEVLDLDTTVEEADIGDMDSVEVHIR